MDLKKLKTWIILLVAFICVIIILLIMVISNQPTNQPQNRLNQDTQNLPINNTSTNTIQFEGYNEIPKTYISDMQMCNIYLLDYKSNVINHPEDAFYSLDEEYRTRRFGDLANYQTYIQEHINEISQIKLAQYHIVKQDNYTQYICIDQFENYYIFNETAIMNYTVILDPYTIDIPQYIDNYNKSNNTQKVAMCIERFIRMLQNESYTYAYTLLSSGFRNNYFTTQDQFTNYVKQHIPKKAKISFDIVKSEGDLYMCTVSIQSTQNSEQTMTKTFIVRLGQDTNFEISFDV